MAELENCKPLDALEDVRDALQFVEVLVLVMLLLGVDAIVECGKFIYQISLLLKLRVYYIF